MTRDRQNVLNADFSEPGAGSGLLRAILSQLDPEDRKRLAAGQSIRQGRTPPGNQPEDPVDTESAVRKLIALLNKDS